MVVDVSVVVLGPGDVEARVVGVPPSGGDVPVGPQMVDARRMPRSWFTRHSDGCQHEESASGEADIDKLGHLQRRSSFFLASVRLICSTTADWDRFSL